jgi:uncharacterized membrane protein
MLFNIIIAFIIPWISGIVFYFKDRKAPFTIAHFQSVIAYTVNSLGFFYNFWSIYPQQYVKFATIPYDLGIYSILSVYLIHFINKSKSKLYILIFIAIIFTTFLECLGILMGKIF